MARIDYPTNPSLDDVFTDPNTGIRRRCVSIDPDVWDYEKGATNTGVPLLSGFWKLANAPDPGYVFLTDTRQSFSRTTYAAAWAKIQTSGMLALTEGAALDGQFGPGDGSTTFTVPNAAGYMPRIIGGVDPDVRVLGDVQEDALQGLGVSLHTLTYTMNSSGGTPVPVNVSGADGSSSDMFDSFVSDGVNGAPRIASETRAKNIAWNFQIKLYDAVDDPAQVNAAQVVADVATIQQDITDRTVVIQPLGTQVPAVPATWNHGLSGTPLRFGMYAECVGPTNSFGYAIGDRISLVSNDGDGNRQTTLYANGTVVGWSGTQHFITNLAANAPWRPSADGGADWNVRFWAALK